MANTLTMQNIIEHPILFSSEMVRAILDGRKTQTRRVIKPQPEGRLPICITNGRKLMLSGEVVENIHCPYGLPGDRLWIREACLIHVEPCRLYPNGEVEYRADYPDGVTAIPGWRPSIHMPRWASRIMLEVIDVRAERVQTITWQDALAEGIHCPQLERKDTGEPLLAIPRFRELWDKINGKRPGCTWKDNPFVWVVEFRRIENEEKDE